MIAAPASFDEYRAVYSRMDYVEHIAFYDEVWREYPLQTHVDIEAAQSFFAGIPPVHHVLEIGGWTGIAAGAVLSLMPEIEEWLNVELCRGAAEHPATTHPAYRAVVLDDWVWNQPLTFFGGFTVLFASHVFEHMMGRDIETLLGKITNIRHLYIDAPLPWEDEPDWRGYAGTHVLEWGWKRFLEVLERHGWTLTERRTNHREYSTICFLDGAKTGR